MKTPLQVVTVLHGEPVLPAWLAQPDPRLSVTFVVNDPAPGRYAGLHGRVLVNERPRGFAANANAAIATVFADTGEDAVLVVNPDVALSVEQAAALGEWRDRQHAYAALAPYLTGADGRSAFSAGRVPRPVTEFTRAAGLRSPGLVRLVRHVLRRTPEWTARNVPATDVRALGPEEYLPWTCLLLTRWAWEHVGPLDEKFHMYGEDVDWGMRLARSRRRAALVPLGRVVHGERQTVSVRTDTQWEVSHEQLTRAWALRAAHRAQAGGLLVRRFTPLRMLAPLDWKMLSDTSRTASSAPDLPSKCNR